ncbi:hypothetical protein IKG20_01050 [Candidatus Saccharibacteria bacterium]|nr:hypothetical protein [Candidatus Saccharibacteria bacterium]
MNNNNLFKYKVLMSSRLVMPEHFKKRYKERVSKKSDKAPLFLKNAYLFGKDIDSIDDKRLRQYLEDRTERGGICKIYRGFVCWFDSSRALTVYPVSGMRQRSRK